MIFLLLFIAVSWQTDLEEKGRITNKNTSVLLHNRLTQLARVWLTAQGGVISRAHITLGGSMLGGVLSFAGEVLSARYLGPRTYGLYALALILASAGETFAVWGLHIATLHYLSIYQDQNERRYVLGTIGASLLLPLLVGSVFAALLWTVAPMLAQQLFGNGNASPFIRSMALSIPLLGLTEIMGTVTRGFGKAGYYVVIRNLVPPAAFLGLVFLIKQLQADPLFIAWAFSISYLMATLVGVVCVLRVGGPELFRETPVFPFRALYTYALPVFLNTVLYLVIGWTNMLFLGALHNEEQVGIFRACIQFVMPFVMIMVAFNASVGHLYPLLAKHNRRKELNVLADKTTRWMSTLALGALLVIALNRHDLMLLMGPGFRSGGDALLVLALGHTVLCYGAGAAFLLMLSGRQKVELLNASVVALLNLVLSVVWIPHYGSVGAAAASSVSCLAISVLRVVELDKLMDVQSLHRSSIKTLSLAVLTALLISMGSTYLGAGESTGIANLMIRTLCTLGVFGMFAVGSGIFR